MRTTRQQKIKTPIQKMFMNWHNFIFSDKALDRMKRHLIFWVLWWIYFAATYYYYVQVGQQKITFGKLSNIVILETFCLLLIHIASCYTFIYFLLPRYLLMRRYGFFIIALLALCTVLLIAGYF